MTELPVITTDTGIKIYPIETPEQIQVAFANKTCANYGLTGGGKSFVSETILEGLSELIPRFLFYSATENVNGAYKAMSPSPVVFSTFSVEKFQLDMEFQDLIASTWKAGIDIDNLDRIYNLLTKDRKELDMILKQLDDIVSSNPEIKKEVDVKKIQLYQGFISQMSHQNLSDDDKKVVHRFGINPCLCIVVDDFAAELEAASKSKSGGKEFFRSVTYNTRHYQTTWIFMLQNVDAMDTKMRENVQTCIFVSPVHLRKYFNNKSNGFSSRDKSEAEQVADKIERMGGHRVVIFCRDGTSEHKWNYMIGKANPKPKPGSKPLRMIMEAIEKEKSTVMISQNNQFSDLI